MICLTRVVQSGGADHGINPAKVQVLRQAMQIPNCPQPCLRQFGLRYSAAAV